MAGGHTVRPTSWVTVVVVVVASILLGFALPLESMALAIAGSVLLLAGIVLAVAFRIMDDAH